MRKAMEELAVDHLVLEKNRPADKLSDAYREHMHQIYLVYEEMVRRVGIDHTLTYLDQARATYELLDPP